MKRIIICLLVIIALSFTLSANAGIGAISILLLGTDEFIGTVTGEEDLSRADAILILSIDRCNGEARLLSVERDYLVTLPGELGRNKLCTATYFGGPGMCLLAVNELFGLNIGLYAQIDISAAEKIIDAIGGVDVEIFDSELSVIRYVSNWKRVFSAPGIHTLNGAQAVATMRSRDIEIDAVESDRNRNDRQHRVLAACMKKLEQMQPGSIFSMMASILPAVVTNITMADLADIVYTVFQSDGAALAQARTPSGAYSRRIINMHNVVVADDMDAEVTYVHTFLYGASGRMYH